MDKKQTMFFVTLISFVLLCGCQTTIITPTCNITNITRDEELSQIAFTVKVEEGRPDSERYFIHNGFYKISEDNFNAGYMLSKPSYVLVQKALRDGFTQIGYDVQERNPVTIDCTLKTFLYAIDAWNNRVFAEIELDVAVKEGKTTLFHKTIFNQSQKPMNSFKQYEDSEPMFSECLTSIVQKAVFDLDIEDGLRYAHGLPLKNQSKHPPMPKLPNEFVPSPETSKNKPKNRCGTGFAVCEDGYIVTAYHVIKDANTIEVKFYNGKWMAAQIIDKNSASDIALLKVDATFSNMLELCETPEQGQKIFTMGYPVPDLLGVEPKYTEGTISSLTGIVDMPFLMQISVPLQPGNSGGPLLNENGQVVGMATMAAKVETFYKATGTFPQNINWAVKSSVIRTFLPQVCFNNRPPGKINSSIEMVRDSVCLIKAE